MDHITYQTEKRINRIKKGQNQTTQQKLAVCIWDNIFASCGYLGATLKELEDYLEHRLDNSRQENIPLYFKEEGVYGIEYLTKGNVRYVGTHDLSYINIEDFNKWIKEITLK